MECEPEIGAMLEGARKELNCPMLTFVANFATNCAKATAWKDANEQNQNQLPSDWTKSMGALTLQHLERRFLQPPPRYNIRKDEMMREGFAEAVSTGRVVLGVVDKLVQGAINECVPEDGH